MEKFPYKMIGGGTILMAVTAALGWGGFAMMIRGQYRSQARLINGTDSWRLWEAIQVPVYTKFYFFNISNPKELGSGAKPKLQEVGPYVYMESLHKVEMTFDKENDTLTYKQARSYTFMPELSDGHKEDDMLTILNVPFVGVANMANDKELKSNHLQTLDSTLSNRGETLTVTHPVKELLFDGWSIKPYADLANDQAMQSAEFTIPEFMMGERYGMFLNKNGVDDAYWEVKAARNNTANFGAVRSYNGMLSLMHWKSDNCNAINGTDGFMYQPLVKNTTKLYTFYPEFCRSMEWAYEKTFKSQGTDAIRFRWNKANFLSPQKDPANFCFCPYDDMSKCKQSGILNLSPCLDGIPLIASNPHFYGADEEIGKAVDGLQPDATKHESLLDIHPLSGLILYSAKRMQYSMELKPYSGMPSFAKASKATVPVVWWEETIEVDRKRLGLIKFFENLLQGWNGIRWMVFLTAVGLVVLGVVVAATRRNSPKVDRISLIQ